MENKYSMSQLIADRRTIRKFKNEAIETEVIEDLLK